MTLHHMTLHHMTLHHMALDHMALNPQTQNIHNWSQVTFPQFANFLGKVKQLIIQSFSFHSNDDSSRPVGVPIV